MQSSSTRIASCMLAALPFRVTTRITARNVFRWLRAYATLTATSRDIPSRTG